MRSSLADTIIDASNVRGREGVVFCLGPFARRVNFTAQQNRALNLVWALHERDHFRSGQRAAVIGGGIAGLTAAAGLIAYGCEVDIFESKKTTVAHQRHTEHRLVHPTISQWPHSKLSITTELPFLEWSAGRCSDVTQTIASQFESMRGSNRLITKHTVVDLSDIATKLIHLKVDPALEDSRSYSLVIIAIGFGEERNVTGFPSTSYWYPDGLEIARDSGDVSDFLISGCGDGGLIDALRILHSNFDKGKLAFDLAAALSDTDLAATMAAGETAARMAASPAGLNDLYTRLADELETNPEYEEAAALLRDDDSSLIYLIDRDLDDPYSLNAAPIHKLMIAHARRRGLIVYRRCEAARDGDDVVFAGKRIPAPPRSRVIIRHGPDLSFRRLLSEEEIATLQARQEATGDLLATPLWPEPYPTPPPLPRRDLGDPAFIRSRVGLATRAVRTIADDVDIMPLAGRLRAIYGGAVPAHAPTQLFGIPVQNSSRPEARGIGG